MPAARKLGFLLLICEDYLTSGQGWELHAGMVLYCGNCFRFGEGGGRAKNGEMDGEQRASRT